MIAAMITFAIVALLDLAILDGYEAIEVASSTMFIGGVFMLLPNLKFWETIIATTMAFIVYWTALTFTVHMTIVT
jgi:hypothetical protein